MSVVASPRQSVFAGGWARVLIAVSVALSSVFASTAQSSAAVPSVERQAGANRYATAVAISQSAFPTSGVPVVFVATGDRFPDALAAGAAAAELGGPLLLVRTTDIPAETAAELTRLDPAKIVVAGGPGVVSGTVETQLRSYAPMVTRLSGADRYETAAQIAVDTFAPGVDVAYVATGWNFPDALAAGPAAAALGGPILLVKGGIMPPATAAALQQLNPDRIVIAGGTAVVPPNIETQLAGYAPVTREAGANRYATAAAISKAHFPSGVPLVYIATGTNFPEALAAGPAASTAGGPVLLVKGNSLPPETVAELQRLDPARIVIAGGAATVLPGVANALVRVMLEPTGPMQTGTVTRVIDGDTIEVNIGGVIYDVRYIGMDTPEIYSGVEWLGPEATNANAAMVAGKQVVLEKDVSETDQYGRLLRYVWVQSGGGWLLVNLELLRMGLATVTTYPPDVKYVDWLYLPAQHEAQAAGIGLWGTPPPPPPPPPPSGGCDPSYPTVCIPPSPPDLDCPQISFRRFVVRAPDPHGFDGDNDGIGCES